MASTEDLARRFFSLVEARDRRGLAELLHPEVHFTPFTPSVDYHGRSEVMDHFYDTVFAWTVYEAFATQFSLEADGTVLAEGRLRWMSNGHLSDVNARWVLHFKDGLLYRLSATPARAPAPAESSRIGTPAPTVASSRTPS